MYQDYYWLNHKAEDFLKKGYLSEGESTKERVKSICDYAETILGIKGFSEKLERYIAKGWISLSSPIWANFAKDRGCPISCFNSFIPDTMNGILTKVAEVGIMTKIGGGTSAYFGGLRPRGAAISAGGASNGPVHFMQLFDKVASVVAQSSVRRGSFAAYLDVEHPDFLEFLKIRSEGNPIQEMSFGACISDAWMNSMIEGDKDKRKTWSEIIKKRFETGYPYLFFTDTINKNKPQVYKDKELKIHSSNLCVTGDTIVSISVNGEKFSVPICDIWFHMGKSKEPILIKSYNIALQKEEYNKVLGFSQTGISDDIFEIEDELGNIIKCTPEHKIYTKNRGYVMAKDLVETDVIATTEP